MSLPTIDITKLRELPLKEGALPPDRKGTKRTSRNYIQGELFPSEETPSPGATVNPVTSVNPIK